MFKKMFLEISFAKKSKIFSEKAKLFGKTKCLTKRPQIATSLFFYQNDDGKPKPLVNILNGKSWFFHFLIY